MNGVSTIQTNRYATPRETTKEIVDTYEIVQYHTLPFGARLYVAYEYRTHDISTTIYIYVLYTVQL